MKLLSSLILALSLAATPSLAQEAKKTIAIINDQMIMRESAAGKSMIEQITAKQKAFEADISKKEEQLQKENQELSKQQAVLSKEKFAEKAKAFRAKGTEMQKDLNEKKMQITRGNQKAVADIQKAAGEIIGEIAKEKGYILVLPTGAVIYFDEAMDITREVITRLDKKLPKLTVNFSGK